ncbi:putative secreted protein (Por secretion system target) [Tenacibaculum gallaicum]|uniref:Putative secreted protein (Por secretion system target) n=1 Tax=Tenacibaculum gallaicum TaxID=561505 RepID=A0A3E0HFX7_9FLAO|nr:SprB repeat-containing protein [Tenacibaculum gallaicum]REH44487.1 putative secreted protein (Por secretion system target) [Tenacibaculum gallaicum]
MKKNSLLNIVKLKKLLVLAVFLLLGGYVWSQEPNDKALSVAIDGPEADLKLTLDVVQEIKEHNTSTGEIQIIPSGGWSNKNYTYLVYKNGTLIDLTSKSADGIITISEGQELVDKLSFGVYKVELRDDKYKDSGNECNRVIKTVTLTNPKALTINTSANHIKCNGEEGMVSAFIKGGVSPTNGMYTVELFKKGSNTVLASKKVTYSSTTNQTVTFSGLRISTPSQKYIVKVSDAYISKKSEVTLNQPETLQLPSANISSTPVKCFGKNEGTISVIPVGGTPPYKVRLDGNLLTSGFNTSKTINNLSAKTYTIQIEDKNGCKTPVTIQKVIQPATGINIQKESDGNPTSYGASNGFINILVSGGTLPYTSYEWYNEGGVKVGTSQNISNLRAGTYNVIVTDTNGCTNDLDITLTEPDQLKIDPIITDVKCFGDATGSVDANVSGGASSTYTYKWEKKAGTSWVPISGTASIIDNLPAGEYRVNVSVIYNSSPVETKDSESIIISQPAAPLSVGKTIKNVSCKGGNDGAIVLAVNGGTSPYTYGWSNGATTRDLSGLSIGSYMVTVTDANDCTLEKTYNVTEPSESLSVSYVSHQEPLAFGSEDGSINISTSGGTLPYSYQWFNEADNKVGASQNISNLGDGTYRVLVTDANGCTDELYQILTQPGELIGTITIPSDGELYCNGDTDGKLEVAVKGGISPYTYHWYEVDSSGEKVFISGATNNTIGSLPAGDYGVEITDSNNIKSYSEGIVVDPAKVEINKVTVNHVSCYGESTGSIDVDVIGGTDTYIYKWYKVGNSTVIGTEKSILNLSAGEYKVVITDTNNCPNPPIERTITINQPAAPLTIVTDSQKNLTGFETANGEINIEEVSGGTAPYTYELRVKGNTTVISNLSNPTGLDAATYVMTILDANNCSVEKEFTLIQPDKLELNLAVTKPIACNGETGTIGSTVIGGYVLSGEDYNYQWYSSSDLTKVIATETSLTALVGTYRLVVTDSNGNTTYKEQELTENPPLAITFTKTEVTCYNGNDGSIDISVTGGTGVYTYEWSNGETIEDVTTLSAGVYTVTVKDGNGCELQEVITIRQPSIYRVLVTTFEEPSGAGLSDGSISVDIEGGVAPFTYEWKDEATNSVSNTTSINNIPTGKYYLTVVDAKGCELNEVYNLDEPDPLIVAIEQVETIKCNGDISAVLKAVATGGVGGNSYVWFNAVTGNSIGNSQVIYNLPTGKYFVKVTDLKGIEDTSEIFTVVQPDVLEVTGDVSNVACSGNDDGVISLNVEGGTPPYSYSWSSGETTAEITVVAGSYFVLVTDANGCQTTGSFTVDKASSLTITETVKDVVCYDSCTGEIDLSIEGGMAPYNVTWNTGQTGSNVTGLCAGTYIVTVTDQKGCQTKKEVSVKNAEEVMFDVVPSEVTLCYGETIEYDVTMIGVSEYMWTSTNGFTSNESVVLLSEEGTYTLTITTNDGCKVSKEIAIHKSNTLIDAQLIMTSQAFVGEDIILINVSNPISEKVEWSIPSNVTIVQKTDEGLVLRFPAPGNYDISLISNEGNCKKVATKTVNVLKARDLTDIGETINPFVKEFTVYSNPNKGKFTVDIELEKESEISLRLFSLGANSVVADKLLKGQKEYEVLYDMNVSAGVYVLLLETPKAKRIQKVIVE